MYLLQLYSALVLQCTYCISILVLECTYCISTLVLGCTYCNQCTGSGMYLLQLVYWFWNVLTALVLESTACKSVFTGARVVAYGVHARSSIIITGIQTFIFTLINICMWQYSK